MLPRAEGLVPLLLLSACILASACTASVAPAPPEAEGWALVLNGTTEKVLNYEALRALPSVSGHGFSVSTVGLKNGPHICRGVDLRDLTDLISGIDSGDQVWVSAPDGYLWVFDYDQLQGQGFVTFDENLKEVSSPPLRVILMYEQDGKPLTYDDGGPARIAIVSEEKGVVTEGSAWVKWVDRIEIHRK